jgi:hypothetical protein
VVYGRARIPVLLGSDTENRSMARRTRTVEGQLALFDPDSDERDEPAAGLDRSTSDEHPERERDEQNPEWREWVIRRVELPAVVEVESRDPRPDTKHDGKRGKVKRGKMLAVIAAIHRAAGENRGVELSTADLARLAHVSPSTVERVVIAAESLYLVEVHARERRPGRQRPPNTYALAWGNLRELVPPSRAVGEPGRGRPLVEHAAGTDVPSHEGTRPPHVPSHEGTGSLVTSPRGAAPTSSLKDVCKDHVHGFRNSSGEGDWLGNVEPADLRNGEWLDATFGRAIAAGVVPDDGPSRVFVFAAACHALRKAKIPARCSGGSWRTANGVGPRTRTPSRPAG